MDAPGQRYSHGQDGHVLVANHFTLPPPGSALVMITGVSGKSRMGSGARYSAGLSIIAMYPCEGIPARVP